MEWIRELLPCPSPPPPGLAVQVFPQLLHLPRACRESLKALNLCVQLLFSLEGVFGFSLSSSRGCRTRSVPLGIPPNKLFVRDLSRERAGVAVGKWHVSGRCCWYVCPLSAPVLQKGGISQ